MSKKILVLDGHPAKGSFCGALAQTYADAAKKSGHDVRMVHLADLSFDPDLGSASEASTKEWEEDLETFWDTLEWCDHFVLAHPLWWGGMPAKLKGLIDRILLPGKAYKFVSGKALPEKLMAGRTSEVLVTSDTPHWYFKFIYGQGIKKQTKMQILDFCGLKMKNYSWFAPIQGSTEQARAKMIRRAAQLGGAL
ncbi:NAD(P)H-dependent oxidoreductase [Roseibium alexandrii]|uniref:Putative NADPH-quinone reductase n=1 Tax=Roseibium alexandrii (strain DSM 17067 / NCIMB 14079 / DFL-11) TaxID=244592 RepID=A0A5E8GTS2_ROSAD|nr:NAD(P)H-dependent oxidoreductase [Roseibium alexandrii]EEE43148.1 putative NADPH-quinone reductase [Roseibium alexandrii DFL-11]